MIRQTIRLANRETGPESVRVSDDLLNILRNVVLSFWPEPDRKNDYFPAPQPVSLERRDLIKLIEYDYFVCVKSDGMRFLMVCYEGKTYMVDRAFKFYEVNQKFNNNLLYSHNDGGDLKGLCGGVFDGELVCNKQGKWQYVIHDCISISGKDISHFMFPERYKQVAHFVEDIWVVGGSEFKIAEKQFFTFRQLNMLNELIESGKLDHRTDGLIFTPRNKKVGIHTQFDLFKWKPRHLHTFDFKIVLNNTGILAYVNVNGEHELYASAPHGSQEEKIFIDALKINCPRFINGNIVECDYNEVDDMYKPIKIRSDKTHPNSKFTVKKTLGNIKENITVEELIQLGNPED